VNVKKVLQPQNAVCWACSMGVMSECAEKGQVSNGY
jgi:hypothetical protein